MPVTNRKKSLQFVLTCLFLSFSQLPIIGIAQENGDAQAMPSQIKELIDQAGESFKAKDYASAGEKIKAAQVQLDTLLKDGLDANQLFELRPSYSRLKRAHELLKNEGIELQTLSELPKVASKKLKSGAPSDSKSNGKDASAEKNPDELASGESSESPRQKSSVSFVKQIAPMLVRNCGGCHVQGNKGNINFGNFQTLIDNGLVDPGKPDLSDLFTVVDDGTMPPQRKLSSNDKKLIKTWIAEGATFDGKDDQKEAGLSTFGGGGPRRR